MNLVCVACHKEMRPIRVGVGVLYHRWLTDKKEWQAFKIYEADVHGCSQCHHQVITGYGEHGAHKPSQDFWQSWEGHTKTNSVILVY